MINSNESYNIGILRAQKINQYVSQYIEYNFLKFIYADYINEQINIEIVINESEYLMNLLQYNSTTIKDIKNEITKIPYLFDNLKIVFDIIME